MFCYNWRGSLFIIAYKFWKFFKTSTDIITLQTQINCGAFLCYLFSAVNKEIMLGTWGRSKDKLFPIFIGKTKIVRPKWPVEAEKCPVITDHQSLFAALLLFVLCTPVCTWCLFLTRSQEALTDWATFLYFGFLRYKLSDLHFIYQLRWGHDEKV